MAKFLVIFSIVTLFFAMVLLTATMAKYYPKDDCVLVMSGKIPLFMCKDKLK